MHSHFSDKMITLRSVRRNPGILFVSLTEMPLQSGVNVVRGLTLCKYSAGTSHLPSNYN